MDAHIQQTVDGIWAEYDKDNSGALDKAETLALLSQAMNDMEGVEGTRTDDKEFNALWTAFGKKDTDTIEKDEMAALFMKFAADGDDY